MRVTRRIYLPGDAESVKFTFACSLAEGWRRNLLIEAKSREAVPHLHRIGESTKDGTPRMGGARGKGRKE